MNQSGEFFSGFSRGYFKWSPSIKEARRLENIEQYLTIQKYEPLMEVIFEYV